MSSKTYVSASISWLYGNTKEWRYALNTEAETVLGGGNLYDALIKRQKNNHKANYNNYISFAQNHQKWLQPDTETKDRWEHFGNQTYTDWCRAHDWMHIKTFPNLTEEEIVDVVLQSSVIPQINSDWIDSPTPKTFTMLGKDLLGNEVEVEIESAVRIKQTLKVKVCQSSAYDQMLTAECMLYNSNLPYWDKIRIGLACDAKVYEIVGGGQNDGGEDGEVASTEDQAVIRIGYEYPEIHEVQPDPTSPDTIEKEENVFYVDEAYVLEPKQYDTGAKSYLYLSYFITTSYEMDSYEMDGEYLVLDALGLPIKIEGSTMSAMFVIEHEREGHDQTIVDKYIVDFDIEEIEADYKIIPNTEIDNYGLKDLHSEPVDTKLYCPYALALRYEGQWWDEYSYLRGIEWLYYCTQKNWSAVGDILDNLRNTKDINETKFIFLSFGLPINLGQYGYVAHYIVQLVRIIMGINSDISEEVSKTSKQLHLGNEAAKINYVYGCDLFDVEYKSGKGKCPFFDVTEYTPTWYAGCGGLGKWDWWYWQRTDDTWDACRFWLRCGVCVKNGCWQTWDCGEKSEEKRKKIIIAKGEETYVRQYSNVFLPLIDVVWNSIPLNDAVDVLQYGANCIIENYKIVKKKWYQTGIFKILLVVISVVVTAVVSFFNPPAGIAIGSFWSALTYAAISAVISVAINTIVASLAAMLLRPILTKVFGNFIGELLTQLTTMATCSMLTLSMGEFMYSSGFWDANQAYYMTGYNANFTLSQNLYNLVFDASFLQRFVGAVEKGINYYQAKKLEAIQEESKKVEEEYERKLLALGKQARETFGDGSPEYLKSAILKKMVYDQHALLASAMVADSQSFVKKELIRGKDYCEQIILTANSKHFVETSKTLHKYDKGL